MVPALRARRPRALARPRQREGLQLRGGPRASARRSAAAGRRRRPGRGQEGVQGRRRARRRQDPHLRGGDPPILRPAQRQVDEPQARHAIPLLAGSLRAPQNRPTVGRRRRHRRGAQGPGAHLADEDRDRLARARPHRIRPRLGHGAQLPDGREPRALEGAPRRGAARPRSNPEGRAPTGICRSTTSPGSCGSWRSVRALPLAHLSSRS